MLVEQWKILGSQLSESWVLLDVSLDVSEAAHADAAASLLAPARARRTTPTSLLFSVARDGTAPSPDGIQRLLQHVDEQGVRGTLALASSQSAAPVEVKAETSLVESWDAALATLPSDWSDLFAEIELTSTDYIDRAALLCGPCNPRRDGMRAALRFRAAAKFGYGASPAMVRRCLERCDADGIHGTVTVLRALSDTRPVGTQGPVWLLAGKTI